MMRKQRQRQPQQQQFAQDQEFWDDSLLLASYRYLTADCDLAKLKENPASSAADIERAQANCDAALKEYMDLEQKWGITEDPSTAQDAALLSFADAPRSPDHPPPTGATMSVSGQLTTQTAASVETDVQAWLRYLPPLPPNVDPLTAQLVMAYFHAGFASGMHYAAHSSSSPAPNSQQ
jgi:hypothetical protein